MKVSRRRPQTPSEHPTSHTPFEPGGAAPVPGNDVPVANGGDGVGEVATPPPPPALDVKDIYSFAYSAGFRLAMPEDPALESLVEMRRHLASYLLEPERDAYERLGESTGQWWAAFGRGWGDRRKGRDPDPVYHGKGPGR